MIKIAVKANAGHHIDVTSGNSERKELVGERVDVIYSGMGIDTDQNRTKNGAKKGLMSIRDPQQIGDCQKPPRRLVSL